MDATAIERQPATAENTLIIERITLYLDGEGSYVWYCRSCRQQLAGKEDATPHRLEHHQDKQWCKIEKSVMYACGGRRRGKGKQNPPARGGIAQ
jgi:hypothetical protein